MIEAPIVFDHVAAVRGRTVTRGALRRRAALSVLGGVVWAVLAVLVVALIVVRGSWWMVLLALVFALLAALTLAGGVLRLRQIPTGESEDSIDLLGPHAFAVEGTELVFPATDLRAEERWPLATTRARIAAGGVLRLGSPGHLPRVFRPGSMALPNPSVERALTRLIAERGGAATT